jgi:PLP dependent protein
MGVRRWYNARALASSAEIRANLECVRERVTRAAERSGRGARDVRLIAISKTFPPEPIREAYQAGVRDFGENRVQEAEAKRPALADLDCTWHLVGHLQTNKARLARELFHWLHSLDSARLAQKLHSATLQGAARLKVLIEVNLGGEAAKSGVKEEEVAALAEEVRRLPTLELAGLMTIPPYLDDPEQVRPCFRRLRELAEKLRTSGFAELVELSMGMSHDFEVAIEEGATMVRIGTAIFGQREVKQ